MMKHKMLAAVAAISVFSYAVPAQATHTSVVIRPSIASSGSSIDSAFWLWLDAILHRHG
jgi:hypothetical protein